MTSFFTNRSFFRPSSGMYDAHYLFNFHTPAGRILVFMNSREGVSSKQQETKTFVCTSIAFAGKETLYWLQQYSIYIKFEYIPINTEYVAVKQSNSSVHRYMPVTPRGVIHYIGVYKPNYQHMVSIVARAIEKTTLSEALYSYIYVSITQELNCVGRKLNVFFFTSPLLIGNDTHKRSDTHKSVIVANHMYFNGPFVYCNTMYSAIDIISVHFPLCEVVLSYELVSVKQVDRHQGDCWHGYYKVRH